MTRHRSPVLWLTTTRVSSWTASRVWPWRPMRRPMSSSSSSASPATTSRYIDPWSTRGCTSAMNPIRASRPSRNSAPISACSSRSSSDASSRRARSRTRTTASWDPTPPNPSLGSWRICTVTSCSVAPSSARATSIASSTLGALPSISSTVASRTGPLGGWCPPGVRSRLGPFTGLVRRSLPALPLVRNPIHEGRHEALPTLLAIRASGELLRRRSCPEHEVLLADLPEVRGRPVDNQPGRKKESEDPEEDGHDPEQGLLLRGRRSRRAGLLHLALLKVRRAEHQDHEEVVGDPGGGPAPAVDGVHNRFPVDLAVVNQLGLRVARLSGRAQEVHP